MRSILSTAQTFDPIFRVDFEANVSKLPDEPGCWLWTGGYRRKGWHGAARFMGRAHGAHRLAWAMAVGPIPDGLGVLHKCDVPLCVRPDHLFLGTQADNNRDMARKGRYGSLGGEAHWSRLKPELVLRGTRNGNCKLAFDQVLAIRHSTVATADLAVAYGVSKTLVGRIKRGKERLSA